MEEIEVEHWWNLYSHQKRKSFPIGQHLSWNRHIEKHRKSLER